MYIYSSDEFSALAQDERIAKRVEKLVKRLEGYAGPVRANAVPFFPGRYGSRYLKHEENAFRVVAELLQVEGEQVVYLHTIFFDHNTNYSGFIADIQARRAPYEPNIEAVRAYLQQIKADETERVLKAQEPQPLPEAYEGWLKRSIWENDWVVYEGHEWVSRFRKKEYQGRWETLCEIAEAIVSFAAQGGNTTEVSEIAGNVHVMRVPGSPNLWQAHKGERWVLFSIHNITLELEDEDSEPQSEEHSFSRSVIFLLAPFDHQPRAQEIQDLVDDSYSFLAGPSKDTIRYNDIARCASRVYPYYLPLDPELWESLEKEQGVNLALSAEEENIIFSLSSAGPRDYRLPIFINGRAGSGKSTILMYLFVEYVARLLTARHKDQQIELGFKGVPLFLTYNNELLKVARDRVRRMLKTRLMGQYSPEELDVAIEPLLKPFRDMMRELLPKDDELQKYFDDTKRITFHEFRQLYISDLHLPEKRLYSPDLCWYVIRTFIKGYSLDGYLDPAGYSALPRKEQIITLEEFTAIHSQIWKWYAHYVDVHNRWDDQDLIRAVLECGLGPAEEYTAIFCDEAQDFTRLELQFILQASIFSRHDLGRFRETASLPFAFAGDPLQTLNPTGFRWASVQSMFYEEIVRAVDPRKAHGLRMNPLGDLKYNYRSTQPIVELTNALLLLRNAIFEQETRPQHYWGKGKVSFVPQRFDLEKIDLAFLKKNILNTIILIPCDEGGELAFIKDDDRLSKLYPVTSPEDRPRNVLSAIGAKGLEFQRVILYKFGEHFPAHVWRNRPPQRQDVAAEYYFNKLYVAATRATQWLFVLDTQAGDQALWSHVDEQSLLRFAQQLDRPERWTVRSSQDENPDHEFTVRTLKSGTSEGLQEISETEPELVAKEFQEKGIAAGNSDYLRRARNYYISLGEPEQADLCEAYALKFEGNLSQAGQTFKHIGQIELARDCFWEGELWQQLLGLEGNIRIEDARLSRFMVTQREDTAAIQGFTSYLEGIIANQTLPKALGRQWRNVLAEYRQRVLTLEPGAFKAEIWSLLGQVLEELHTRGYSEALVAAGKCYLQGGNLRRAIHCWEESQYTQHRDYYVAKARSLGYPLSLDWWDRAGEQDQIYQAWQEHGGFERQTDSRVLRLVAPILEKKGRYWDACQALIRILDSDEKKVMSLLDRIGHFTPGMMANFGEISLLLSYLSSHDQWEYLTGLTNRLSKAANDNAKRLAIRQEVVRLLAKAPSKDALLDTKTRDRLYQDLIRPIRDNPDMRIGLELESELGPAVEALGFDHSLSFYEKFVDDDLNVATRDFARKRWLANGERKFNYHREHNEEIRNARLHSDYQRRKRDWTLPGVPGGAEQPSKLPASAAIERIHPPIQGLPTSMKVVEVSEGQLEFRLGDVRFVVNRVVKVVKLEDSEYRNLVFKLETQEILPQVGFEVLQENTPVGRIFSVPAWKMAGTLRRLDASAQLEIAVENLELESPVTIEL